jgi:phosphatidylglycerol:prolipoprotein diacylglycerol transferase
MYPELFSIGPLTLHTYGLLIAIGLVVGIIVAGRIGRLQGIEFQKIMDMGLIIIITGIIGSRLAYVIINFSYYKTYPLDIFKLWNGGLVFSGGLIAVLLMMVWYAKKSGYSLWQLGDLWAPAAAVGQAIGRIGCFMAGCCYGKPTDIPWGVVFTDPRSLVPQDMLNIPLHPTQLYSSLSGFIIFIILMILSVKKGFEGQVLLWFLILHSTGRLLIERFRGDDRGLIFGGVWTATQFLTVIILIVSVIMLFILKSRKEKLSGK